MTFGVLNVLYFVLEGSTRSGEAEEEILSRTVAQLLDLPLNELLRRARISRALERNEAPLLHILLQLIHDLRNVRRIRILILAQRRRDANADRIHFADMLILVRSHEPTCVHALLQRLIADVLDVGVSFADAGDLRRVQVNSDDAEPLLAHLDRERQTDISETNDSDDRRLIFDVVFQIGGIHVHRLHLP